MYVRIGNALSYDFLFDFSVMLLLCCPVRRRLCGLGPGTLTDAADASPCPKLRIDDG